MGIESPQWDKTVLAQERVEGSAFYEEPDVDNRYGKFEGRTVIGRDVQINGGVYLGGSKREAIVVDDQKYPEELDRVYKGLLEKRKEEMRKTGNDFKRGILTTVFEITKDNLPYDDKKVDTLTASFKNDTKVTLNYFIQERAGVCRHQALLGGYLLERLKKDGYVSGHVSVDRNTVPNVGGHAWIRYTNSKGDIFIIDPAQEYIGKLDSVGEKRWFYERPDDVKQVRK